MKSLSYMFIIHSLIIDPHEETFTTKNARLASGYLAFYWNALLLMFCKQFFQLNLKMLDFGRVMVNNG